MFTVLELLRKNPAGAIPVILRRLKQKDLEWRKARQDLNKGWKDVLEKNYHKKRSCHVNLCRSAFPPSLSLPASLFPLTPMASGHF
ncbi:paired amphipathic helix protein sin3 [Nannochloropsis gaditana]|uniref:Paired amphipathic helix protein sin3 n=1 Tax=Nannochloropsis gaditana TaxID=72520 RepID=W7THT4_9STRA|nr:paired amphipathic helix protein sin3 [Nannochloropsis gaditana]